MSGENVARLPVKQDADAPALGMSLQVDLGLGRIATLQTFVPNNASTAEINGMLAKMTAAGDCQRAHYKLEELHRDLAEEERKHAQMQADAETNVASFNAEQEARTAEVERRTKILANFEAAKQEQRGAGRRGEVKLGGADAAGVKTLEEAVKQARKEIVDADLRYATEGENYKINLKTHAKAIERIRREIERCKEIEAAGLKG